MEKIRFGFAVVLSVCPWLCGCAPQVLDKLAVCTNDTSGDGGKITSTQPPSIAAGSGTISLTLLGKGFLQVGTDILWTPPNGGPQSMLHVTSATADGSQMVVTLPASLLQSPGTAKLQTIVSGCEGLSQNSLSAPFPFAITPAALAAGPDLTLAITPNPATFTAGTNGVYTLTVSNVGTAATTGTITVTDTLPNGLGFVSGTGAGWSCLANGQVVTCTNAGPIATNNGTSTIALTVSVAAAAVPSVSNMATVSTAGDSNAANNSASDPTMVAPPAAPDLALAITPNPASFTVGTNGVYTLTVSNVGNGATTGTITVTDTLPNGLGFVSSTGTGWSCSANAQIVTCTNAGPIAANNGMSAVMLTVSVAAVAVPGVTNMASVSTAGDNNAANNSASNPTTVNPAAQGPSLSATKTHIGHFAQGQIDAQYTITVSNAAGAGPTDGTTVTATETLPLGLSLVNMIGTGWDCSIAGKSCTRKDVLQPGQSYPPITVIVNVANNALASVTNQVAVSGGGSATANGQDVTVIDVPAGRVSLFPTFINLILTQGNTGQFLAVVSNDKGGGASFQLVQNGIPCAPVCGTLAPSTVAGQGVTYTAPTGIPLPGINATIVATSVDFPNESASGGINVIPCSAISDLLCGQHTLFVQGFKNDGSAAVAAASFTATGLENGPLSIAAGVMDINDEDGTDVGLLLGGSYTFDAVTSTGTLTLTNQSLVPSHQQRTYAFTAGTGIALLSKAPIIEMDLSGFQGSGFLAFLGTGNFGGFPSGAATQGNLNVEVAGKVATFGQPNQAPQRQGLVGLWKLGVAGANCISSGAADVVANRAGTVTQFAVMGPCTASDPVTGRGTLSMGVTNPGGANLPVNPEDFAFYFSGRNELVLVSTTADVLGGTGQIMNSNLTTSSLGCGVAFGPTGLETCLLATSGGSKTGGSDVTLTLGHVACPPPPSNPGPCNEKVTNGILTGDIRITQDQVSAGMCNGSAPGTPCGRPQALTASYSISSATGVGFICTAASCPNGPIDPNAITYSNRFLLANDKSVAIGDLTFQSFLSSTSPFACTGQFFDAGTAPAFSGIVPNILGPLEFTPNSPPNATCTTNDPFIGTIGGNLEASGSNGIQDPLAKVSGTFTFDKGEFTTLGVAPTGRGMATVTGASPEPASSVFYVGSDGLFLMQTDNPVSGGQALLHLRSATADCFNVKITPFNLSVPVGGSTQTTIAVVPCPNTDLSSLQLSVSGPLDANSNPTSLPNGISGSFSAVKIDPLTGYAVSTLTLTAALGTATSNNNQFVVTATTASLKATSNPAGFAVVP
jgi:uncharacterized repeat protein (TIGR01451 family)